MSVPFTLDARIRAYVAAMPAAISGSGGHVALLNVANVLVLGFALSFDDAWPYIAQYSERCEPPWSDRELEHKLDEADKDKQGRGRGYLLDGAKPSPGSTPSTRPPKPVELTQAEKVQIWTGNVVTDLGGFEADPYEVWESSVVRLMDDYRHDSQLAIFSLAADPEDLINVNFDYRIGPKGRVDIIGPGITLSAAEWNEYLAEYPMPYREAGCWWRPNPVRSRRGSGNDGSFTDADIAKFRFHLFEIDHLTLELQLSFFCKIQAPIAMISDSAGRSLHALVESQAATLEQYQAEAEYLLNVEFAEYGVDTQNKNPSRYSRLPGVPRGIGARVLQDRETDARQKILYLNPHPSRGPIS
jgi:hypothetical protein